MMGNPFSRARLTVLSLFVVFGLILTHSNASWISEAKRYLRLDGPLTILPLGDSLTAGMGSIDVNGYRQFLLDLIGENKVHYIGSQHYGNMTNNQNEGWGGYEIDMISEKINSTLSQHPEVILLLAGTNDIRLDDDVEQAPRRLARLIDQCQQICPGAVIIVAQILPFTDNAAQTRSQAFNAAVKDIISARIAAGEKILLVDMQDPSTGLSAADLIDGVHPGDSGYAKMAQIWFEGLRQANEKQWFSSSFTPETNDAQLTKIAANKWWALIAIHTLIQIVQQLV